jgi:hypothetical protein
MLLLKQQQMDTQNQQKQNAEVLLKHSNTQLLAELDANSTTKRCTARGKIDNVVTTTKLQIASAGESVRKGWKNKKIK